MEISKRLRCATRELHDTVRGVTTCVVDPLASNATLGAARSRETYARNLLWISPLIYSRPWERGPSQPRTAGSRS
jgi:hypothetical protein